MRRTEFTKVQIQSISLPPTLAKIINAQKVKRSSVLNLYVSLTPDIFRMDVRESDANVAESAISSEDPPIPSDPLSAAIIPHSMLPIRPPVVK